MEPNLKELYDAYFSSLQSALEEYCTNNHVYPWEVDVHPELTEDQSVVIQLTFNRRQETNE